MTKLDPATARAITLDWAAAFPELVVWKPLRLLRRLGPVVQGITLDRSMSGEDYRPTAHVHALIRQFPGVSLTLWTPVRSKAGVAEWVDVRWHARDFATTAERLRAQSPLSLDDPPTLEDLLACYRRFVTEAQHGLPAGMAEIADLVLIPAALDLPDAVRDGLAFAREIAGRWTEPPRQWPDADAWLASIEAASADPGGLRDTVRSEVHKLKLAKVPNAWPGVLDVNPVTPASQAATGGAAGGSQVGAAGGLRTRVRRADNG
jgi:hypothetical protein